MKNSSPYTATISDKRRKIKNEMRYQRQSFHFQILFPFILLGDVWLFAIVITRRPESKVAV